MANPIKKAIRRLIGSEEDRASLWSGLNLLQCDAVVMRRDIERLRTHQDISLVLQGKTMARLITQAGVLPSLRDAEFKVFSQFGDDGIIQYLVRLLDIRPDTFVEFGVTDYTEANTRFLLVNDNWRGLVMDGGEAAVASIRRDSVYTFHDLTAVCAFIDRNNIDNLLRDHGFSGEIGILSIDIDGNDYWVWEAIDSVNPVLTIVEYNSLFGPDRAVTIPYDPLFQRHAAHPSNLYYGASLAALCHLADRKGYAFIGSNSNGNNAYFVRRDRLGPLRPLTAAEGWIASRFREAVGPDGTPLELNWLEKQALIANRPLVDVLHDQ